MRKNWIKKIKKLNNIPKNKGNHKEITVIKPNKAHIERTEWKGATTK